MLSALGCWVLLELSSLSVTPGPVDGQLQAKVYSNSTVVFSNPDPTPSPAALPFETQCLLAI